MKAHLVATVWVLFLLSFENSFAESNGLSNKIHKYWICAVSTYRYLNNGNQKEYHCRANTEYSESPCREFYLEFEGPEGIRPSVTFKQTVTSNPKEMSSFPQNMTGLPVTTTVEIKQQRGEYVFTQIVEQATSKWVYKGHCDYFEAPLNEKIHRDKGLNTGL